MVTAQKNARKRVVGVFRHQKDVERVIQALKDSDYDMNRVSLLARNIDSVEGAEALQSPEETVGNEAGEGAGIGASTGTVLGGLTGFLIGVGLLAIPGVGPILAAGAEIGALGSTLAGAGIGAAAGGIIGALVGLGIPEERAKVYESRINAGHYLLAVSGSDKLDWVKSLMNEHHAEELEVFGVPEATASQDVNRTTMTSPAVNNDSIKLHQERLVADKKQVKTGEVAVGKRVETETERVSVPISKERIVVERSGVDAARPVAGTPDFQEGEVIRTETYAEQANIGKEAYVREEVDIRKEVEKDTVTGKETLRREELDVDTTGRTDVVQR